MTAKAMTIGKLTIEDLQPIAAETVDPALVAALEAGFERMMFTRLQRAHFLAQVAHESGGFYYMEELASGEDYEGRGDLGNTEAGDGVHFKGRGLIQVTGRSNYAEYGRWANVDAIANPELLSQFPHAVDGAFWFWQSNGLSALADADDALAVTRRINGGTNGLDDRMMRLEHTRKVYGV